MIKTPFIDQLAEVLASKAPEVTDLGLLNGKAGIAIFLYKYSTYKLDRKFKEAAEKLVDDICDRLPSVASFGFSTGLSGIGWCFQYLLKNGFLDESTDDLLFGLDEILIKKQSQQRAIYGSTGDFFGTGVYSLSRLYSPETNNGAATSLPKAQNILFLIEECGNILSAHLLKNTTAPAILPQTLISIGCFMLEAYKLGLNTDKLKKLIKYLPTYIEASLVYYTDRAEISFLLAIVSQVASIGEDKKFMQKCQSLSQSLLSATNDGRIALPNLVKDCSKMAIYNLVFDKYLTDDKWNVYISEVSHLSYDETLKNDLLDNSCKYNLGLSGGLAGIGLALLDLSSSN